MTLEGACVILVLALLALCLTWFDIRAGYRRMARAAQVVWPKRQKRGQR